MEDEQEQRLNAEPDPDIIIEVHKLKKGSDFSARV
jgi:hypothetical protein